MQTDPELGSAIKRILKEHELEGPYYSTPTPSSYSAIREHFENFIIELGLDINNESVQGTPSRVAKMYMNEICAGMNYNNFPKMQISPAGGHDEIVLIRDIEVHSLCEHHFVPIIGRVHVAYIPANFLLGLSKFNRLVEFFSRRPQLQERLTEQVSISLRHILGTEDVAVIVEADHFCTRYRGIQDPCSDTVTSSMKGKFREVPEARHELLQLIALKGAKT